MYMIIIFIFLINWLLISYFILSHQLYFLCLPFQYHYHEFLLYLSLCVTRPSSIYYHKNIDGQKEHFDTYCQGYIKLMSR